MLIVKVCDLFKQPCGHNKLDKGCPFEGKQIMHYAAVFIKSFSRIINRSLQRAALFFKQVLKLKKFHTFDFTRRNDNTDHLS